MPVAMLARWPAGERREWPALLIRRNRPPLGQSELPAFRAASSVVRPTSRRNPVADLTVMTWNIQNLFPVGQGDGPATQQEYDDKIAGLAEVINAVAPDVLALQEVGPEQVLADLNAACSINFGNRVV